jgi:hypothetical protein
MTNFGRSFEANGLLVLPCQFCGNPVWEEDKHSCPGLVEALIQEMEDRDGD